MLRHAEPPWITTAPPEGEGALGKAKRWVGVGGSGLVTTAPAAAAATTAATTTTAAEAAAATAAPTTAAAARALLRLVHLERAPVELLAVPRGDRRLGLLGGAHLHEAKAARLPGVAVGHQPHVHHLASALLEGLPQSVLTR